MIFRKIFTMVAILTILLGLTAVRPAWATLQQGPSRQTVPTCTPKRATPVSPPTREDSRDTATPVPPVATTVPALPPASSTPNATVVPGRPTKTFTPRPASATAKATSSSTPLSATRLPDPGATATATRVPPTQSPPASPTPSSPPIPGTPTPTPTSLPTGGWVSSSTFWFGGLALILVGVVLVFWLPKKAGAHPGKGQRENK